MSDRQADSGEDRGVDRQTNRQQGRQQGRQTVRLAGKEGKEAESNSDNHKIIDS